MRAAALPARRAPPRRARADAAASRPGVTVFSINSGYNTVDDIEFAKRPLLHIGQDEVSAGEDVAQALYDAGKRHAACINDEASNTNKVARCTAFDAKFVALGGTVRVRIRPHPPLLSSTR